SEKETDTSSLFTVSPISAMLGSGVAMTLNSDRDYTFPIVLFMSGGALHLGLNYNKYEYRESTIQTIVAGYRNNLRKILRYYLGNATI
ncbi:MAG TPA: hypothetical protein VHY08_23815, partial [Bacillota bacterium]|nr:hypothetical protein [Bacillota bacterium]